MSYVHIHVFQEPNSWQYIRRTEYELHDGALRKEENTAPERSSQTPLLNVLHNMFFTNDKSSFETEIKDFIGIRKH